MRKNIIISLLLVIFSMAICFALAACNNKNGSGENSADSEKKYSEGLKYVLSDDKTFYYVCGIGSCSDADVFLPSTHEGKPVKGIWSQAFQNCTNLASVTIGDNVTSIGDYAFSGCSSLTNIVIPNNVTTIGGNSFQNCTNLTSVTIGNGVTSIYGNSFQNCTNLANVTIGDNVTSIEKYTFSGCSSLTSVTLINGEAEISDSAFYKCEAIKYNEDDYGYYLGCDASPYLVFMKQKGSSCIINDGCVNILGSFNTSINTLKIPSSVKRINEDAFYYTTVITSAEIPAFAIKYLKKVKNVDDIIVTSGDIGNYAFSDMKLKSVTIASNATYIGMYAFQNCFYLDTVYIPNSVTEIGKNIFYTSGWSVDPTIIYNGTMEQWKNIVKDKQWKGTNGIYGTSVSITIKCVDGTLIEE